MLQSLRSQRVGQNLATEQCVLLAICKDFSTWVFSIIEPPKPWWISYLMIRKTGTSLVVQSLRFQASTAGDMGLIPGLRTKIPHTSRAQPKTKQKLRKTVYSQGKGQMLLFSH